MDELTLSTGRTAHGLRTILLESASLRVVVLPEAGARILQITYKPLEAALLWNHPSLPTKVHDLHSCYDRLAAALRFDPKVFPSCWLFAAHGGWRNLNVAVLEPATGYPFRMQPLIEGGRARTLAPGESLETTVLFSVQEGLTSIGGVEPDGRILPGAES